MGFQHDFDTASLTRRWFIVETCMDTSRLLRLCLALVVASDNGFIAAALESPAQVTRRVGTRVFSIVGHGV